MTATDPLTVLYDADCGICSHSAAVLRRLDSEHRLRLVPLQAPGSLPGLPTQEELLAVMHVVDGAGRWDRGGAACLRIADAIPALRPLAMVGRLPFAGLAVEWLYVLAAHNRGRLSRLLGVESCAHRARRA